MTYVLRGGKANMRVLSFICEWVWFLIIAEYNSKDNEALLHFNPVAPQNLDECHKMNDPCRQF